MPLTQKYITDDALWRVGRRAAPSQTGFYMCLSTSNTLTAASPVADFLTTEVTGNGYARQPITYSADGTFNTTTSRHELPQVTTSFTATGGSIVWRSSFVIYDGRVESSATLPAANINISTDVITLNAHGLANGEELIIGNNFSPVGGLISNTIYKACNVTTNTFQVSSDGTTPIDLTSVGAGNYRLYYAKGSVKSFVTRPSDETIANGSIGRILYDDVSLQGTYV
ncbi:MAG: hypothetical protein ACRC62_21420 [Microcoleus sp.]